MAGTHAESHFNRLKRPLNTTDDEPSPKKAKGLLEDDESSAEGSDDLNNIGGVAVNAPEASTDEGGFKVNQEYARRFEYNKKREELSRLEDKYGSTAIPSHRRDRAEATGRREDEPSDSSSDEDEDDDGELALGALDEQVQNTLEAIRKKDPRVYDTNVRFYDDLDAEVEKTTVSMSKKEKPLYLSDYHRKNLLEGDAEDDGASLPTYQQQQDDLKNSIVKEMHATVDSLSDEKEDGSDEDGFLVKASKTQPLAHITNTQSKPMKLDVESADKDPETYLSNFMSAKAWVPSNDSKFQAFESDDEEQDRQAEAFEEAYNLRFEDPKTSNEKLMSHARDTAAKYSVRKEETNPRKKKRDLDKARKDEEQRLRSEEKARLRKLKVADLEEKIQKIRNVAGMKGDSLPDEDWSEFLNEAWDDDRWEQEMQKRFGDDYYDKHDADGDDDHQESKKKKIRKPKWNDDIDINDLVPDFNAEEENQNPPFRLTDEDEEALDASQRKKASKKSEAKAERDKKKEVRLERRKIEQMVDEQLDVDEKLANFGKKHAGTFRYRETSPMTHGLTAHDILMANDSQLNQFAGLKKLAAFRDPDKKRKDKKHLGKKQRLRQWRKETFGSEQGPTKTLAEVLTGQLSTESKPATNGVGEDGIRDGDRKKKRSRKVKASKPAA